MVKKKRITIVEKVQLTKTFSVAVPDGAELFSIGTELKGELKKCFPNSEGWAFVRSDGCEMSWAGEEEEGVSLPGEGQSTMLYDDDGVGSDGSQLIPGEIYHAQLMIEDAVYDLGDARFNEFLLYRAVLNTSRLTPFLTLQGPGDRKDQYLPSGMVFLKKPAGVRNVS
jgi:hypothetical protein